MEELTSLVEGSRSGNLEAFGTLVRRFQDMAHGYAYSILGDFDLAEDAAQEAFIEAYRKLSNLIEPEAFPGWFRRIVFGQCGRIMRTRRIATVPIEEAAEMPSNMPDPSETAQRREIQDKVLEAIRALPEKQREATTLFYIDGYSVDDIAQFLQAPVTTVKKRLHDSRKRLKERMMGMVEETLKAHALDEKFGEAILKKMKVDSGRWIVKANAVAGKCEGNADWNRFWGRLATKESWPGDAVVVEFDGMSVSGFDGAHLHCFMSPRATTEETRDAGEQAIEFSVQISCCGRYHFCRISRQTFLTTWSREMAIMCGFGDFTGKFGKWYHIRAEKIGKFLRLWVDDVPVFEIEDAAFAPERIWVSLGSDVSRNRFQNLRVYRPDEAYIRKHSRPVTPFAPYRQKKEILAQYPAEVVREASIQLGKTNRSKGIREWESKSVPLSRVKGKACRKIANEGKKTHFFDFRLENFESWKRYNEIELEVEYLDEGPGSIVGFFNTWWHPQSTTEDMVRAGTGEWKTYTFDLREAAFRDLGKRGSHFSVAPIHAPELCLRSVRLVEIARPKESYEAVVAAYRKEIAKRKDEWTVPHYLYAIYLLLRHNLKTPKEEWQRVFDEIVENYPDSECLDTHHHLGLAYR